MINRKQMPNYGHEDSQPIYMYVIYDKGKQHSPCAMEMNVMEYFKPGE